MSAILNVETVDPPYQVSQQETAQVVRQLFSDHFQDIERLLLVFDNGGIERRNFIIPPEWLKEDHGLEERNNIYTEQAVKLGSEAVENCFRQTNITKEDIDAIFFVSSSGLATPTIDARIMNVLDFPIYTKRIPLWGLGCAGGASGISRAHDYCQAYPSSHVLVICIEFCSLTFQREDKSKSNLIGTSLFADGVACALVAGEDSAAVKGSRDPVPYTTAVCSTLMKDSEEVMGWDVKDNGLNVVFSRDIPAIITSWLKPNVISFLNNIDRNLTDIDHFVAHPGGKKVLEAYENSLSLSHEKTKVSREVLKHHGNMSSPTVLYVLKEMMRKEAKAGDHGLLTALGPGFSSELVYLVWR